MAVMSPATSSTTATTIPHFFAELRW